MSLLFTCLYIFFGRIVEMSISTIKTVLTIKEKTFTAALMAFVEITIWFFIARNALNNTGGYPIFIIAMAYAGGYSSGTYIGGKLAKKVVSGHLFIDVITSKRDDSVLFALREAGYGLTVLEANNYNPGHEKYLIIFDIDKKDLGKLKAKVKELDPDAYIIVRETKTTVGGYYGNNK